MSVLPNTPIATLEEKVNWYLTNDPIRYSSWTATEPIQQKPDDPIASGVTLNRESRPSEGMSLPPMSICVNNKVYPKKLTESKKNPVAINATSGKAAKSQTCTLTPLRIGPNRMKVIKKRKQHSHDDSGSDFKLMPTQLPVPPKSAHKRLNPLAEEWKPGNRQNVVHASPHRTDAQPTGSSEASESRTRTKRILETDNVWWSEFELLPIHPAVPDGDTYY